MTTESPGKARDELDLLHLFSMSELERETLLYPARYGPADSGALAQSTDLDPAELQQALIGLLQNGCTIQVRLTASQADDILHSPGDACNRREAWHDI
jgi:hypothetical protein